MTRANFFVLFVFFLMKNAIDEGRLCFICMCFYGEKITTTEWYLTRALSTVAQELFNAVTSFPSREVVRQIMADSRNDNHRNTVAHKQYYNLVQPFHL